MGKDITVLAIMGISFSGSTLVNMMLDTHPEIYGGGELLYLLKPEEFDTTCRNCKVGCPIWTSERIRGISKENFYPYIADLMETRFIVDTGKSSQWFSESMGFGSDREIRFLPIILVKDPIRHIASLLINNGFAIGSSSPERAALAANRDDRRALFEQVIKRRLLLGYALRFKLIMDRFGSETHLLHYEKIVENPAEALEGVLDAVGLEYHDEMKNCYAHIHHQIAGNDGAVYQQTGNASHLDDCGPLQSGWYRELKGIAMDNKYKRYFTEEELDWLNNQEAIRRIRKVFGYDGTYPSFLRVH